MRRARVRNKNQTAVPVVSKTLAQAEFSIPEECVDHWIIVPTKELGGATDVAAFVERGSYHVVDRGTGQTLGAVEITEEPRRAQ